MDMLKLILNIEEIRKYDSFKQNFYVKQERDRK